MNINQSQASTTDQLRKLQYIANQNGLYDAADIIEIILKRNLFKPNSKIVGYVNLYTTFIGGNLLHWSGSLNKTREEALKLKDKYKRTGKTHFIGEVSIEIKEK